jgi:hypothetical protein
MTRTAREFETDGSTSVWLARRPGPVQLIDDALLIVRRAAPAQLVRGWLAALPLGTVALLLYYLERVEGFRTPRLALAAALVLAFWLRFYLLALLAREFVHVLRPALPLSAAAPSWVSVACTASVAAFGLWCWAWPMLALGRLSVFAVLGLLPLFALRGAVAPSCLARAACAEERGLAAFARAVEDTRGARAAMLTLELLLGGGFVLLFGNLYLLGALVLLLANSVLGLDVAFVSAFLAPDNELVPLLLLGATLLLLEPLRAALSALAFAEARGRNEGADLHAAIDALARERPGRAADGALSHIGAVLCLLLCIGASASPLFAQASGGVESVVPAEPRDRVVRARAQRILERGEFHEFDASDGDGLQLAELFDRLFGRKSDADPLPTASPRFELRVPPWAVVLASLFLLAVVTAYVSAEARKSAALSRSMKTLASTAVTPLHKPGAPLADAAVLARAGQYRDALRALYSATLVALDRASLIRLDPSRTNGQYVRSMPSGPARQQFGVFTENFECKCYGDEPVTQADYEQAECQAEALCQVPEREA